MMNTNVWRGAVAVLGRVLLAIGMLAGVLGVPTLVARAQDAPVSGPDPVSITEAEQRYAQVYREVSPSVVSIIVYFQRRTSALSQSGRDQLAPGGGTGFVIDRRGYIVTNAHVVEGAVSIEVYFLDGTIAGANVIGIDLDSDIAVLQVVDVPSDRLQPVTFGDSSALVVGQQTLAIGSPFGEGWTLTGGIVSALNRTISGLNNYLIGAAIQTDAAINPGNSGGPLLNLNGEVIGVNSQILSATRSSAGIGFAVPSNLVVRVVDELLDSGRVNYSYLGIGGDDLTLQYIRDFNLPNNLRGAVVRGVDRNTPAAQAGLLPPNPNTSQLDVITAIDGNPINNFDALLAYLAINTRPGQSISVTVYRQGQLISLPLRLGERPRR